EVQVRRRLAVDRYAAEQLIRMDATSFRHMRESDEWDGRAQKQVIGAEETLPRMEQVLALFGEFEPFAERRAHVTREPGRNSGVVALGQALEGIGFLGCRRSHDREQDLQVGFVALVRI